jgi:PAS domain S-box-containing protein
MLQTILDNVTDGVLVLDADWRITEANRRAETLFRRRRDGLVGRLVWEALPDVAGTRFESEVRAAREQGLVRIVEHFYPSLYVWHKVRAAPSADGNILLLFSDITEIARRQHSEAVREAVRNIVRQAPIAISITRGPEHRFEVVNEMSLRLIGGREVEGRTLRDAFPELEGQGFVELLDQVFTTGQPFQGQEMPVEFDRTGEGEMVKGFFNVIYQPLFEADGRVSGILSLSVDVTDLVTERAQMQRAAAEHRAILAQLLEGVIVTDAEGRIRFVNAAAERMHGTLRLDVTPDAYTREYHLLREDGSEYPAQDLPLARAALNDEVVTNERWLVRRVDGTEARLEGSASPVFAEGKKLGAVLTMREI